MKLYYISPSVLPSRTANSIHVIQQCNALNDQEKINLTLFATRANVHNETLPELIKSTYGVSLNGIRLATFYNRIPFGNNILICLYSLYYLFKEKYPDLIISRNLYASFFISVFLRRKIIYETHELEIGIYKYLQRWIVTQPHVTTVVISKILATLMISHHKIKIENIHVLHDAAPEGLHPITSVEKKAVLKNYLDEELVLKYDVFCGYFGHLYPGRGMQIISNLAQRNKQHAFLVVGGNDKEIEAMKKASTLNNLIFVGYVPHLTAQKMMAACDVLLMPYQKKVSIGAKNRDTSRWMSPMKMFEYLGSGVPIISSDLPVLKEVLIDSYNALLVPPEDVNSWHNAIERLKREPELHETIGNNGYENYRSYYTWSKRAQKLLTLMSL